MKNIKYPDKKKWSKLIQRPTVAQKDLSVLVNSIFNEVQKNGDKAILKYNFLFDKSTAKSFVVTEDTVKNARQEVSKPLQQAIKAAKRNIEKFHSSQKESKKEIETTKGVLCWRENRPIEKVGIYIPGGTAPLFSTVLMLGIPAKIAGCKEVVMCTPPDKSGKIHPAILFAAGLVGITKIYAVGGIQAIGAMTFGTKTIPKVDKLFGPGNQYVTAAKNEAQNFGVSIDMPAGPSEVLVIADRSCKPEFVAADLLSQAEHGADSQVILSLERRNRC
jgi:histidinol dehydrogenase